MCWIFRPRSQGLKTGLIRRNSADAKEGIGSARWNKEVISHQSCGRGQYYSLRMERIRDEMLGSRVDMQTNDVGGE